MYLSKQKGNCEQQDDDGFLGIKTANRVKLLNNSSKEGSWEGNIRMKAVSLHCLGREQSYLLNLDITK